MWWVLAATPAVSLAIQVSTGYIAHSPDEAAGLGPDALLVLLAMLLAIAILARLVLRWRSTGRSARIEALAAALAVIPLVAALSGIGELVGWPRTRTSGAPHFVAAAFIVLAWTAIVLFARHRLRFSPRVPPGLSPS
ncbi:MAG TPA: hypothetical protein VFN39_01945 [Gemmatimonadaceae bacterium]|nr:hypothetical protein [Gemmatimonadaceae bacterium]